MPINFIAEVNAHKLIKKRVLSACKCTLGELNLEEFNSLKKDVWNGVDCTNKYDK